MALSGKSKKKGFKMGWQLLCLLMLVTLFSGFAWACGTESQGLFTENEVRLRRINIKNSGIEDAIYQVTSGEEAKQLLAIAIHEAGGKSNPLAAENSIGATCAFQIMPNGHIDAADAMNLPRPPWRKKADGTNSSKVNTESEQFKKIHTLITTDPVACVKGGRQIFKYFLNRTGGAFDAAVCGYGAQCVVNGGCKGSLEIKAIMAFLDGRKVEYTTVDKTTPANENRTDVKHGDMEVRIDGELVGTLQNCRNMEGDLGLELAKAAKSYQAVVASTVREMWDANLVRDREAIKDPDPTKWNTKGRGEILANHCLDKIMDPNGFFKMLRDMFSGGIAAALEDMLNGIINAVVARTCTLIASALNSAMNQLCLPLPNFSFTFSLNLPTFSGGFCSGLSMADLMEFSSNYTPSPGNGYTGKITDVRLSTPSSGRSWTNIPPVRGFDAKGKPIY